MAALERGLRTGRTVGVGGNGVDGDGEKVTARVITGCAGERRQAGARGEAVSTPAPDSKSEKNKRDLAQTTKTKKKETPFRSRPTRVVHLGDPPGVQPRPPDAPLEATASPKSLGGALPPPSEP